MRFVIAGIFETQVGRRARAPAALLNSQSGHVNESQLQLDAESCIAICSTATAFEMSAAMVTTTVPCQYIFRSDDLGWREHKAAYKVVSSASRKISLIVTLVQLLPRHTQQPLSLLARLLFGDGTWP